MEKIWLKNYPQGVKSNIDLKRYKSLNDVFEEAFESNGAQIAFSNMGVSLTYEEVNAQATNFAAFLQSELGLKKGERIAIQMPNLLQFPIALIGALKAGLVVVNTNPLYTAHEMEHQFRDSGAVAVVILANYAHLLQRVLSRTQIKHVVITEIGDLFPTPKRQITNFAVKHLKKMVPNFQIQNYFTFQNALSLGQKRKFVPVRVDQSDIAFLQYTGGTTGVAKGAMLTHRNVLANMLQIVEWMKPLLKKNEETVITALPMYHIFSLTLNCITFLWFGAKNVLITNPKDIPSFVRDLKRNPFSVMVGVNTLFNALLNNEEFKRIPFTKLKISVAGAAALQSIVSQRWKELTCTSIIEGYGLTEASPVVSCNPINGAHKVGTIGLPLPDTEIKLIDDNDFEVSKVGESGELCVRGPQVMLGYWHRDDETKKVLDKEGWLKTGDIASIDEDGFLKIVDRKKDMILVSGFNVYPNEVEDALASHPGIAEVAAVGLPHPFSGEIVKVFVVKRDPNLTESDIIDYARKSLTNYKVPKLVEFRSELPKTNVGKILRRALRENP